MSPEWRRDRVKMLFSKIAFFADLNEGNPKQRDELIKPLSEELWAITKEQWKLGELEHLHSNLK